MDQCARTFMPGTGLAENEMHMAGLLTALTVQDPGEMGRKTPSKRRFPPLRFSLPRVPISLPSMRTPYRQLREDMHVNPERYRRLGDYLLYAGVVAVLGLSVYIFAFAGQ